MWQHVSRRLKEELAWATYKRLWVIIEMLFKTVGGTSEELKNRAVLSVSNIVCIAMWSLLVYPNCFKCNLSKNQQLLTFLLLKVHLCLVLMLFITVSLHYKIMIIHSIPFARPGFLKY